MKGWIELADVENEEVWNRFLTQYEMKPSISNFPGIKEPMSSITYSIVNIYNQGEEHYANLNSDLMVHFQNYFKLLVNENDWLYALDWQHTCYKFNPHSPYPKDDFGEWLVPILPNGDYYIFLENKLRFGVFGHPWEKTMCIFGNELISIMEQDKPALFNQKIRVNGKIV